MTEHETHLAFWRGFAQRLERGLPLVEALRETSSTLPETDSAERVRHVADAVEGGANLSQALAEHPDMFTRTQVELMRAGESGGVVDIVARRILESIERGFMPLPGVTAGPHAVVAYWRLLALMLNSGVPLLRVLECLRHDLAEGELADATGEMHAALLAGCAITSTMDEHAEIFPDEVRKTMELAESRGELAEAAARVAEAMESRDLGRLMEGQTFVGAEMSPAHSLVNTSILWALQSGASDIHFEPGQQGNCRVRLRIDGVMHEMEFPQDVPEPLEDPRPVPQQEVVNRVKVMAGLDVAERRLPQDGRIQMRGGPDRSMTNYDLRVSTVPVLRGERVCMRIIKPQHARLSLPGIEFLDDDLAKVKDLLRRRFGLILMSGPTGSGKTTTLYAMFNEVSHPGLCAMSVEDPVAYELEGVCQVQVDPRVGRTFARSIRSILRQDPDVIMIGELRDTESANLGAQCALTGHLTMACLHAETALEGLKRLLDMGVPPFVVNACVTGTISQRLVRKLCDKCKTPTKVAPAMLPAEAHDWARELSGPTFYEAVGCDECRGTGYRGRAAIHEVLVPGPMVREAIAADAPLEQVTHAAREEGTRSLLMGGLEKAARGITTVQEVLRVAPPAEM